MTGPAAVGLGQRQEADRRELVPQGGKGSPDHEGLGDRRHGSGDSLQGQKGLGPRQPMDSRWANIVAILISSDSSL